MKTFNFSANGINFGNYSGDSQEGEFPELDPHFRACRVESEPIECPEGENWGVREIREYPDGSTYNCGHRAGGTWVDGWWN